MRTETITWHGITIAVEHGKAPVNRFLHRFRIVNIVPVGVHLPLPLPPPRYEDFHYVGVTELAEHSDFCAYLIARLDRDAIPALIRRNAKIVANSRQLCLDL